MKFWIVNITSFCNQKCIFCSEWDMHDNPKHIPIKKVYEILDNLKKDWVEWVNFMWWECTMRSDLWEILDYCNLHFKFVSIVTNGVMFSSYKYAEKILWKVWIFELSWHTNIQDKFNYLSWSDTFELFQKWLINISKILEDNSWLWIVINHVINKINYEDILGNVKIFIEKFPLSNKENRFIALKRTNIIWYSKKNENILAVSPNLVMPFLKEAIKYCIENKVHVQIEWFPPCYFNEFMKSEYFLINEIESEELYLLNKVDISKVDDITKYNKQNNFNNIVYMRWNIELNKNILKKCKTCLIRKVCHKGILLWEDSNILNNNILEYIWFNITLDSVKYNIIKRQELLKNIIEWST